MLLIYMMLSLAYAAAYMNSNDSMAGQPRRDYFYVGGQYTIITVSITMRENY
jgi:hypothetical protein